MRQLNKIPSTIQTKMIGRLLQAAHKNLAHGDDQLGDAAEKALDALDVDDPEQHELVIFCLAICGWLDWLLNADSQGEYPDNAWGTWPIVQVPQIEDSATNATAALAATMAVSPPTSEMEHAATVTTQLRHVSFDELETAIIAGLQFHEGSTELDLPEMAKPLAQIVELIPHHGPFSEHDGCLIVLKDGSQFLLSLSQVKAPEFEHEDQLI